MEALREKQDRASREQLDATRVKPKNPWRELGHPQMPIGTDLVARKVPLASNPCTRCRPPWNLEIRILSFQLRYDKIVL